MNILFFTTALEHTTFRKTAKMLQDEGAEVKILGFTRNNFPVSELNDVAIESLGTISHGNYLQRLMRLFKLLPLIRREAKQYDVIYTFTLDTLLICRLSLIFKKKIWVYQIQDIRAAYFGDSIKSRVLKSLEKIIINRVNVVVVSSLNYYTDHFKPLYNLNKKKLVVIENKLLKDSITKIKHPIVNNQFVIGYFGVMRCNRSWKILHQLALNNIDKIKLYLRGKPIIEPDMQAIVDSIDNITFGGLYKSPDELDVLYNNVDIVWAAYPYSDSVNGNWKYARTIRFYESLAYGKPVIVQKGTPQEADVIKYNIGLIIDMKNVDETINRLSMISIEDLSTWSENINKLDESVYFHQSEYKDLLTKLNDLKKNII